MSDDVAMRPSRTLLHGSLRLAFDFPLPTIRRRIYLRCNLINRHNPLTIRKPVLPVRETSL